MAPIYLVSACSSGEEFVAAFRRYADKHGLFVPIAAPFAVGRRSRFAVTLRDGGVMIEGEAEIVSSARTPSVLHGRVGMTLKFVEPDPASKTMLAELEKARLSMRPPPPSVAPRPAVIPAEPRPVPPAAQGRIDAVNALAECVAIGEAEQLDGLALVPPSASPAKAGPRFVVPTIAPGAPGTRPKTITTPPAGVPPLRTVMGMAPLRDDGPRDRMSALALPAPPTGPVPRVTLEPEVALPRTGTRQGVAPPPAVAPSQLIPIVPSGPGSDTMTVPVPRASSPTDIGGSLDAAAASEPTSPGDEPAVVATPAREDGSARTQVHAGIPPRDPTAPPREPARSSPLSPRSFANAPNVQTTPGAPPDMLQTLRSPPPDMQEIRATIATRLGMPATSREGAPRPSPPVVAAARAPAVEVELAEPTDLSMVPQATPASDAAADVHTEPEILRPRKTAMGVAVIAPDGAGRAYEGTTGDLTIEDGSLAAAEEPTGADPILDGNATIESADLPAGMVPTLTDEATPGAGDEPTPSEYWTIGAGGALAPSPKRARTPSGGARATPATPPGGAPVSGSGPHTTNGSGAAKTDGAAVPGAALPSGDWLIALDPGAPDGWSAPFETVPAAQVADEAPEPEPRRRPMPRVDAMPAIEPKVQIDPTLIEPLATLPAEDVYGQRTSSPNLPMYAPTAGMPPTPYGQPAFPPQAFGPPTAPAYPLDPSYQMVPIASPRAVTAGDSGNGFGVPRHALPARARRRRVIIVLASAIVAVVIGVVLLARLTAKHDATGPADKHGEAARPAPAPPAPVVPPHVPAGAAIPASPAEVPADPPANPAAEPAPATTTPVTVAPGTCYADVSSQPPGAEIVLGAGHVVGTTPQKITLPCGDKVELTIRKGRLVPASRSVTPTAEGAPVRVALGKQMVQVKVSSLPMGATITLNGKSLGVTPTTIRLPALETSSLTLAKDGYATDTQKVTPKANGVSLHATLRKLERRPR